MESQNTYRNKSWLIAAVVFFIGFIILTIVLINYATIEIPSEPPLNSPEWYNIKIANDALNTKKNIGCALTSVGMVVCIIVIVCCITTYVKTFSKILESATNKVSKKFNLVFTNINDAKIPEPEKYYCEYCGILVDNKSLSCKSCGAGRRKNKT